MSFVLFSSLILVVAFNILAFVIAFQKQTDKLTDITYSASFVIIALYTWFLGNNGSDLSKIILVALVSVWAIRLGVFLLMRVGKLGHDARFEKIRPNKKRFFRFFLIQGFGAWIISTPFAIRLFKDSPTDLGTYGLGIEKIGLMIAIIGFLIEIIADHQKNTFKSKKGNDSKIYTGGLYSMVRYPNYLGEILFWLGIFIYSSVVFSGLDWISVISPICITYLLLFLSGIPFLEKSRNSKYGNDAQYVEYKKSTSKILPGIF